MRDLVLATMCGMIVGGLFSFFDLPVPAPPTMTGVMGVFGIYFGFMLINSLL